MYLRLFDGYMMYTDIDFRYHSHISTTFNLTLNNPLILTDMLEEVISTEGTNH